jgi:hypothetical protein
MSVRSSIQLNERQIAVLDWIKAGCPNGVYDDEDYSHRISARALKSRGLVEIQGHGKTWTATLTPRGELWPEATEEDEQERRSRASTRETELENAPSAASDAPPADAAVRAGRRLARQAAKPKPKPRVKIVEKRGSLTRFSGRFLSVDHAASAAGV